MKHHPAFNLSTLRLSTLRLSTLRLSTLRLSTLQCHKPKLKKWLVRAMPLAMLAAHLVAPLPSYGLEFPESGDRGAPARTAGGGTRGGLCEGGDWTAQSIKALIPQNNVSTFAGDRAALWIYLAEGFEAKDVEIYVQDPRSQTGVYQAQMPLSELGESGIITVALPPTDAEGTALFEDGQDYFWEVAIICNANDRTQDYIVQGLINRVAPDAELAESLASANLEDQAEAYASANIWQETLTIAASLKTTNPELWASLLTSVGLGDIASEPLATSKPLTTSEPLADCCSLAVQ